ncbi:uncharacterized protein LOC120207625 [Hibiscus syriacus]|uniref:uncharacterized protein LOC120207625 n=1 Tax=Hibiscus syriacus TaxID=106335 RepID=UPI001920A9B7|nr:uncharacterized protein LOC120207625 [Hibiscus syriacus]
MAADPSCTICGAAVESSSHIFRDCIEARSVWNIVVKPELIDDFLSIDLVNWIETNLRHPTYYPIDAENWEILFGLVIWNLWMRRNRMIFDRGFMVADSVLQQSKRLLRETVSALMTQETWTAPRLARVNRNIQWKPPSMG